MVLHDQFISESCCFADIDNDNNEELIAGPYIWKLDGSGDRRRFRDVEWAFLPEWTPEDRIDPFPTLRPGAGPPQYRNSMHDFPVDLTGDGKLDVIWIGMHTEAIRWCENRSVDDQVNWPVHVITPRGVHESVVMADVTGSGLPALITVSQKPTVVWYESNGDARLPWTQHVVGQHGGDWHGLGFVDVNGDGVGEVITKNCIYTARGDVRSPWLAKSIRCVDDDGSIHEGLGDVFIVQPGNFLDDGLRQMCSGSPHAYGLWWWELLEESSTEFVFGRHEIPIDVSQTHAVRIVGKSSGVQCVVTGKRWQAHGPAGDVDPKENPKLLVYSALPGEWDQPSCEVIDDAVGIGMCFDVRVLSSGQLQVAVSNKNGVHVFTEAMESTDF